MFDQVLLAMASYAFGRQGARAYSGTPPGTAVQREPEAPPAAPKPMPSKPAQVPWPAASKPKPAVPQTGPRGGKEPPKAVQKKAGQEERRQHERAIANLQTEKKQRLAELASARKLLEQNIAWQSAHPSEAADKGVQAQASKVHALERRIVDIDSEIAARKAAIARLPK